MDEIFVTVLVDDGEAIVMPGLEGENSHDQAQERADRWEKLGHNAIVGRVVIDQQSMAESKSGNDFKCA